MSTDINAVEIDKDASRVSGLKALVKAGILLGLGFYFASMVFSDTMKNYSNQPEWLTLSAAGLFTLLGLASLMSFLAERAKARKLHHHSEVEQLFDHDGGHVHVHVGEHEHRGRTSWAILLVAAIPLALGILLPSKPLGAAAISGNGLSGSTMMIKGAGPSIAEPQSWNIMEWQLAIWHKVHPPEWFDGKKVDVVGFVIRQPDIPSGNFLVGRFVMYHCAADAKGVALLVNWPQAAQLPLDTWVHVQGTMQVETMGEGASRGPTLHVYATKVDDKIGEPESPYLRPFLRSDSPGG